MPVVRLNTREVTRVYALAILAVLCLVPSVGRLWAPAETLAPMPVCDDAARVDGAVRCGVAGAALDPVQGLWAGRKIALAEATADELTLVPGIGAKLAARIVEDRALYGPFTSVEDLQRVRGIGVKLSARAAMFFTVR